MSVFMHVMQMSKMIKKHTEIHRRVDNDVSMNHDTENTHSNE